MLRILLRVQAWHRVRERTSGEWAGTELEGWAGTTVSRFGITTRLMVDGGGPIAPRPKKILSRSTESPSRTPASPPNPGYFLNQIRPVDLFAEVALHFVGDGPPARVQRRGRQPERGSEDCLEHQRGPNCPTDSHCPAVLHRGQPAFSPNCSGRIQHEIRRSHVVPPAFRQREQQESDDVHPTQHAEAPTVTRKQAEIQTSHGKRKTKAGKLQLLRQKVSSAALANIAGVNVAEKIERHEIVLHLPKQVGQPYQDGNSYPDPEPFALEVAPRVREKQGRDDAQHEETDGVLREHAEADTEADAYPPSRVVGYKQPNDKVRRRYPSQAIEGHVLHLVSTAQAEWDGCDRSDELCSPAGAHIARHQSRQHHCDRLRQSGKEPEAAYRRAEQFQGNPPKKRRDRGIRRIAQRQVPRVFQRRQFVAVDSVAVAEDEVQDDRCQRDVDQQSRIAKPDRRRRRRHTAVGLVRPCRYLTFHKCHLV